MLKKNKEKLSYFFEVLQDLWPFFLFMTAVDGLPSVAVLGDAFPGSSFGRCFYINFIPIEMISLEQILNLVFPQQHWIFLNKFCLFFILYGNFFVLVEIWFGNEGNIWGFDLFFLEFLPVEMHEPRMIFYLLNAFET